LNFKEEVKKIAGSHVQQVGLDFIAVDITLAEGEAGPAWQSVLVIFSVRWLGSQSFKWMGSRGESVGTSA